MEYWLIGSFEIEDRPNAEIIFAGTLEDCREVWKYTIQVQDLQRIDKGVGRKKELNEREHNYLRELIGWLHDKGVNLEDNAWLHIHEIVRTEPVR